jgi:hypothetical protein
MTGSSRRLQKMNYELSDLLVLAVLIGLASFWWQAHAAKDLALEFTRRYCASVDVQLLDDALVLSGFWLKRDPAGKLCLRRSYSFEFTTTGEERYHGATVMLGRRLESVQLAPHRLN